MPVSVGNKAQRTIPSSTKIWYRTISIKDLSLIHIYQGHFPGQPVVPGVCTLQMIKESAEQIVSQPLQYVQIASSKFLSAINPLETPLLQLFIRLEETEEHLFKLQAEGICNGKEFIKLKAVLMASKYQ